MTNNIHTHYDTLMVSKNASAEVIRAAFKSLSQKYHPDKSSHPDADRIMQQFNESYKVLSDPIARSKYDRSLSEYERESNDKHDYTRADNGSKRQNKVVIINIPDSISLSGTKEKIHNFVSTKPRTATPNSKALKLLLNLITIVIILTIIVLLTLAIIYI